MQTDFDIYLWARPSSKTAYTSDKSDIHEGSYVLKLKNWNFYMFLDLISNNIYNILSL